MIYIICSSKKKIFFNVYLILVPTIMCKIASNSSFDIRSSLSKSYILNATENVDFFF